MKKSVDFIDEQIDVHKKTVTKKNKKNNKKPGHFHNSKSRIKNFFRFSKTVKKKFFEIEKFHFF